MITEQFLSCNKCEQKIFQTYQNGSPIETFKHILIMTLFSPKFRYALKTAKICTENTRICT